MQRNWRKSSRPSRCLRIPATSSICLSGMRERRAQAGRPCSQANPDKKEDKMKTREEIFDGLKKAIREMEVRNIGLTQPSWEAIILAAAYLEGKHNWIPVEERLPEPGKDVLVWSSGFDEPMVGCFKHWNWQRKQHMFYVHNDRNMWGNITHWMPMPQPPRKEDKE